MSSTQNTRWRLLLLTLLEKQSKSDRSKIDAENSADEYSEFP
jgi:hypothetical protein